MSDSQIMCTFGLSIFLIIRSSINLDNGEYTVFLFSDQEYRVNCITALREQIMLNVINCQQVFISAQEFLYVYIQMKMINKTYVI